MTNEKKNYKPVSDPMLFSLLENRVQFLMKSMTPDLDHLLQLPIYKQQVHRLFVVDSPPIV